MNRLASRIDVPARLTKPRHPYPGLRPFEPDEWSIFFGRDRMVDDVIDRLARDRLVFVHGASGSGKSSLVRAGVLPRLARHQQREGFAWRGCMMRPSGGPIWNLARAFAEVEGRENELDRIEEIARRFNGVDATLSSVAGTLEGLAGERLCILVDQFEELFRFAKETSREEAEVFVELLTREFVSERHAPEGGARAHVVITMRSEFLGECARYDDFAELINRTNYLVPHMDRDGLVRAITRPAELYGGEVAPALASRLIAEARGREDELPLIQHALMLIWNDAKVSKGAGETIRLDARLLEKAGSVRALLSNHADEVLASAAPNAERMRVAEEIFRALTDINSDGVAIRRPMKFSDLVAVSGGAESDVRAIIDAFRADGVSFVTPYAPDTVDEHTIIDIGHESVIRCWGKIADPTDGWLSKEFRDGQLWRTLIVQSENLKRKPPLRFSVRFLASFFYRERHLPRSTIDKIERWMKERNAYWSNRHGGNWETVCPLVEESVRHWKKVDIFIVSLIILYPFIVFSFDVGRLKEAIPRIFGLVF